MTEKKAKTWFITGCDKGIGRAIAETVLARGDQVAVTVLAKDGRSDLTASYPERCRSFHLDVTDARAARDVAARAEAAFGGIDVLVNNAGFGLVGAAEETVAAEYRPMFEVNFFGLVEIVRAVLPGMRRRQAGNIINFSSTVGFSGPAGFSFYSASKFAVEGYSESLSKELRPLGIFVTIIEPGGFRSDFAGASLARAALTISDYDATSGTTRDYMTARHGNQPGDPARLGGVLHDIVNLPAAPLRLPLGADAIAQVQGKIDFVKEELAQWKHVSVSTDFLPA